MSLCQCITIAGQPCKRTAKSDSQFCFQHQNCQEKISSDKQKIASKPPKKQQSVKKSTSDLKNIAKNLTILTNYNVYDLLTGKFRDELESDDKYTVALANLLNVKLTDKNPDPQIFEDALDDFNEKNKLNLKSLILIRDPDPTKKEGEEDIAPIETLSNVTTYSYIITVLEAFRSDYNDWIESIEAVNGNLVVHMTH